MDIYVEAMKNGRATQDGWPDWISIPSKIGQVAAARIAARLIQETRPNDDILINTACPGLIDTEASRPWFDDMSKAQSPDQGARHCRSLVAPESIKCTSARADPIRPGLAIGGVICRCRIHPTKGSLGGITVAYWTSNSVAFLSL